jgi:hypothetical protein
VRSSASKLCRKLSNLTLTGCNSSLYHSERRCDVAYAWQVCIGGMEENRMRRFQIRNANKTKLSGLFKLSRRAVFGSVIALIIGVVALPVVAITVPALSSVASANGVPLKTGDVLASVGNADVDNYSPSGTLLDTLDTASGSEYTTGGCFDSSGNFYVTDFSTGAISEFDPGGNLVNSTWATDPTIPESCSIDAHDNMYVGGPGAPIIYEYNSSGAEINTFDVTGGSGTGGTDWLDLEADQCTLLYTGEGSEILSYNTCTDTQNPDFATGLPAPCFELRVRPDGDVMVACASEVLRFDSAGTLEQTYAISGTGELFSMNLDPDNSTFWTGDDETGEVYHVDIATGTVISAFNSAPPVGLFGLTLVGAISTAQGTVTLTPPTATHNVGQKDTVTATITNPGGSISGQTVNFSVSGANTATGSGTTNASGQTTFSYIGTNPGGDLITGKFGSATGTATVTWDQSSCDSGPWPSQVNGVPTVKPGESQGFYIGVATHNGQDWYLPPAQWHHHHGRDIYRSRRDHVGEA